MPYDINDDLTPILTFSEYPSLAVGKRPWLAVDLVQVITDSLGFLVTGGSGSGKSHAVRGILEQTAGRVQQIVFDTEGEYVTLRERFDYLLAAKAGGDIPLAPATAAILCRRVMELGVSVILDIYELRPADRQTYVAAFLSELMETPTESRRPVLVAIPEVHLYAPQGPNTPAKEAVRDLVARGRKRGLMPLFDTQNIAKTDKTALEGIRNHLVGYMEIDVQIDRAADSLGLRGEDRQLLKQLPRGTFFAQGPALSKQVTLVRTAENLTHAPPPGSGNAVPALPMPTAIAAILSQFEDIPEEAAAEVATIVQARKRIGELETKLSVSESARSVVVKTVSEKVEVPVLSDSNIHQAKEVADKMVAVGTALQVAGDEIIARLARWDSRPLSPGEEAVGTKARPGAKRTSEASAPAGSGAMHSASRTLRTKRQVPATILNSGSGISGPQQRILDSLAAFRQVGLLVVTKHNVAAWAGVAPTSGSYANNLSALRSQGLVEYPSGGMVELTPSGWQAANEPTNKIYARGDLLDAWCARVTGPQERILRTLHGLYPESVEKARLAESTGVSPTSGSFANNLGALRSLGLVDYPRSGVVVATNLMFPEGLPE